MTGNKITQEYLQSLLFEAYKPVVVIAESVLSNMATGEIDKVPTIKVTKEQKDFLDNYAAIIDIPYPEKDFLRIYCVGSCLFKIIIE